MRASFLIRSISGAIGLALLLFVVLIAVTGIFITPMSPDALVGGPFEPPSQDFLLGTDMIGRDVVSRTMAGGWRILLMSLIASGLGVTLGVALGLTAGYAKGWTDDLLMRASDVVMSFPQTILALLFVSMIGPLPWVVVLLVAIIHAPQVARVIRSVTLRVVEEDYIRYVQSTGVSGLRILLAEVLPNVTAPILVEFGLRLTYSIALIASLGFLGLAQDPTIPDWGIMINENRIGLFSNPWPVAAPIVLLALLTVGINLFFDSLSVRALPGERLNGKEDDVEELNLKPGQPA